MTAEARKQQIVQVALETIGKYGVQGATISRIARGAGITTAALYTHFENRHAILLAALDAVYEAIFETHRSSSTENVIERLREICEYHAQLIGTQSDTGHAHLFLELVAAAPEDGLRDALREKQLAAVEDMAQIVAEGQRQGAIAAHVDPRQVAWLIAGWAWTGDVAHLMGVRSVWHPAVSSQLLDLILESIAPGPPSPSGFSGAGGSRCVGALGGARSG
jgi:AcrR family transcriptional regulator